MKSTKRFALIATAIILNQLLMAGWVITSETDEGLGTKETEITYIQDNKFKTVTDKDIVIFNFVTDQIILMNPASKTYWSGNLSEFKNTIVSEIQSKMEAELENIPAERREMYKEMYQEAIDKIKNSDDAGIKGLEVRKAPQPS